MSFWISISVMFICLRETDRFLTGTLQTLSLPTLHLFQHFHSNTGIRYSMATYFFLAKHLSCLNIVCLTQLVRILLNMEMSWVWFTVKSEFKENQACFCNLSFSFCVWVGRRFWVHGQSPNGAKWILMRPSGTCRGFGYQTQHCSETGPIHIIWWVSQSSSCCLGLYFGSDCGFTFMTIISSMSQVVRWLRWIPAPLHRRSFISVTPCCVLFLWECWSSSRQPCSLCRLCQNGRRLPSREWALGTLTRCE